MMNQKNPLSSSLSNVLGADLAFAWRLLETDATTRHDLSNPAVDTLNPIGGDEPYVIP